MKHPYYELYAWFAFISHDASFGSSANRILLNTFQNKEDAISTYNDQVVNGSFVEFFINEVTEDSVETIKEKDHTGEYYA